MAASARRDHRAAIQAFEQAVLAAPADAESRSRLALERLTAGDLAGARRDGELARTLPGAGPKVLDRLGHIFCRARDYELGVDLFRQAAAAAPRDPAILKNLAWGAQYVGAFEEAREALTRALAVAPDDAMAWFTLSGLPDWRPTDADMAALERLAAKAPPGEAGLAAGHALARALESQGAEALALAALTGAKAAHRSRHRYDLSRDLALFQAAPTAWGMGPKGAGDPSQAPIFVVGPPRSGTTLLDRILSSHAQVVSAGELPTAVLLAQSVAGVPGGGPLTAEVVMRAAHGPAASMGAAYLKAAAVVVGAPLRFIDKRPFNLILAGMISRILPNARILRMRRAPMDAVLGNYRQFFNVGSPFHGYSHDLEDTARYIAGMEALSEAWEARLPADRYRVIDYEALVAEPERVIRAALTFCGLDWDPACLNFHNNQAAVSTASAVQVREPLHGRNIDLWRRYGDGLDPARAILRAAGRAAD